MPFPRSFRDDGDVLHLDVHGCTIPEALDLVQRALVAGARYGRSRLDVIHGYSTSHSAHERTIRNALADSWEDGAFDVWVADVRWDEAGGRCAMWLKVGGERREGRIALADIT